jgi:hypothetical protein
MFRTVPLSIIRSFSLYTQQWYMLQRFADSLRAGSGWNWVRSLSCSQAVSKTVWHIPLLCVQWKTPDDGHSNCPKHVEFHSNNKFEKLVHLFGFIIRKKVLQMAGKILQFLSWIWPHVLNTHFSDLSLSPYTFLLLRRLYPYSVSFIFCF